MKRIHRGHACMLKNHRQGFDYVVTVRRSVLLEIVALSMHEDQEPAGLGREPEDGNPAWRQQQKLLAHGENPDSAAGIVQGVVKGARLGQRQRPVVQGVGLHPLTNFVERADLLNRPLRTRTVGGGGPGEKNLRLPDWATCSMEKCSFSKLEEQDRSYYPKYCPYAFEQSRIVGGRRL